MDVESARTHAQLPGPPLASPQDYDVAPGKLIDGNPQQTLGRENQGDPMQLMAGLCASEIGARRVRDTAQECFRILDGVKVITDDAGRGLSVAAGGTFVIPGRLRRHAAGARTDARTLRRQRAPLPEPMT